MHSDKEFVLSNYETANTAKSTAFIKQNVTSNVNTLSNLSHTLPCEQGGMSMLDLVNAMKSDSELQISMLSLLSARLDWLVQTNDQRKVNHQARKNSKPDVSDIILHEQKESIPCFEGKKSPIAASKYVERILKYGRVSECCFLVAIIYIERLKLAGYAVRLSSTSLQRMLAVAVMVASKFLDEPYYSNKWW